MADELDIEVPEASDGVFAADEREQQVPVLVAEEVTAEVKRMLFRFMQSLASDS